MREIKYTITVETTRPNHPNVKIDHDVEGKGETRLQTFCSAVGQIAKEFPQSRGHSIIRVKSETGKSIEIEGVESITCE